MKKQALAYLQAVLPNSETNWTDPFLQNSQRIIQSFNLFSILQIKWRENEERGLVQWRALRGEERKGGDGKGRAGQLRERGLDI